MKVLTVINNNKNYFFNLLRLSCALNNLELVVLVSNDNFRSRRVKDDLLSDYLEEENDDEIILFTDGFDALFIAKEEEILPKFYNIGKDLVFSAETGCWPDKDLAVQYPNETSSSYKYLNSGGFIGKAGTIKELLKDNSFDLENFKNSNQYLWTKRYFKNMDTIALDTDCEIFCTFSPEVGDRFLPQNEDGNYYDYYTCMKKWFNSNFSIVKGRIFNKITNTWPCQAHFNGTSKYLIDDDIINMIYENIPDYKPVKFYYEEN